MLDVLDAGRRIEVFIEGKDLETRRFFLTVSPQGSGEEKFAYAGSAEELADAQRQVGTQNCVRPCWTRSGRTRTA